MLGLAAQLHDVGKIGLPDGILLKPGKLTQDEFRVVKKHCDIGFQIVQPVDGDDLKSIKLAFDIQSGGESPLLEMASRIALTHHEKWDGTGYPNGLANTAIPIEGRITSVADVFDALTTERPYKAAFPPEKAMEIMEEGRGAQFDPNELDALIRRMDEVLKVCQEQADPPVKPKAA